MTPSDLRIAMAELDGWKIRHRNSQGINWVAPNGNLNLEWFSGGGDETIPPNYPFDLNAVHELEKKLTDEQSIKYIDILGDAVNKGFGDGSYGEIFNLLTATALQRCEALARLHGKWKD